MKHFYYKENFFDVSTREIEVFDEDDQPVYTLSLYYMSSKQQILAFMGREKHNFQIIDGKNNLRAVQERSLEGKLKTPFRTVWKVLKNGETIGELTTKIAFKPKMNFIADNGEVLNFGSGFVSRSVTATNSQEQEIMNTKSERFKIASRHDIEILDDTSDPALLLLLFQVFYEYQEHKRSDSN